MKLIRLVAYFTEVRPLGRTRTSEFVAAAGATRTTPTARASSAGLPARASACGGSTARIGRPPALPRQPPLATRVARLLGRLEPRRARASPSRRRVVLCGNPRLLDPVCRELRPRVTAASGGSTTGSRAVVAPLAGAGRRPAGLRFEPGAREPAGRPCRTDRVPGRGPGRAGLALACRAVEDARAAADADRRTDRRPFPPRPSRRAGPGRRRHAHGPRRRGVARRYGAAPSSCSTGPLVPVRVQPRWRPTGSWPGGDRPKSNWSSGACRRTDSRGRLAATQRIAPCRCMRRSLRATGSPTYGPPRVSAGHGSAARRSARRGRPAPEPPHLRRDAPHGTGRRGHGPRRRTDREAASPHAATTRSLMRPWPLFRRSPAAWSSRAAGEMVGPSGLRAELRFQCRRRGDLGRRAGDPTAAARLGRCPAAPAVGTCSAPPAPKPSSKSS